MTRKHFNLLAKEIASLTDGKERRRLAKAIASFGQELNPLFDYEKWFRACNVLLSEHERKELSV